MPLLKRILCQSSELTTAIERFHSIPRETTNKEQGGHVGVPNNRSDYILLLRVHNTAAVTSRENVLYG